MIRVNEYFKATVYYNRDIHFKILLWRKIGHLHPIFRKDAPLCYVAASDKRDIKCNATKCYCPDMKKKYGCDQADSTHFCYYGKPSKKVSKLEGMINVGE